MTAAQFDRRLRLARDLASGLIDEADARRQLADNIGIGRDDLALLRLCELEARMLAEGRMTPRDAGDLFSEFATQLEDPIATLGMALEAEMQGMAA
jgi:hypothetical protein